MPVSVFYAKLVFIYFKGNLDLLIDHFLDIFQQTSLHRMQATFIINEIMLGTIGLEGKLS